MLIVKIRVGLSRIIEKNRCRYWDHGITVTHINKSSQLNRVLC